MRKVTYWTVAAVLVCGLTTGCGGPKGTPDEAAGYYNEAADVLKDVKDKKSAEDAKPKLKAVGEKLKKSIDAAAKNNPAVTSPGKATYPEAEQKKLNDALKRYMDEMTRISKDVSPDTAMDLSKTFAEAAGIKVGM